MVHFFDVLAQWGVYLLPSIVAWIQRGRGKNIVLPFWMFFLGNLLFGWTVVLWILLMLNAFGLNPIPWVAFQIVKIWGTGGAAAPATFPQGGDASSSHGTVCSHCGGSRTIPCTQCQGRGTWYTQPTTANEIAQLEGCSYCMRSGRIQCPYGPH